MRRRQLPERNLQRAALRWFVSHAVLSFFIPVDNESELVNAWHRCLAAPAEKIKIALFFFPFMHPTAKRDRVFRVPRSRSKRLKLMDYIPKAKLRPSFSLESMGMISKAY